MLRASRILGPRKQSGGQAASSSDGELQMAQWQIARYEALRREAQALAAKATQVRSEHYLMLASSWIALADELERLTRNKRNV
jgi:hypothetical protein